MTGDTMPITYADAYHAERARHDRECCGLHDLYVRTRARARAGVEADAARRRPRSAQRPRREAARLRKVERWGRILRGAGKAARRAIRAVLDAA